MGTHRPYSLDQWWRHWGGKLLGFGEPKLMPEKEARRYERMFSEKLRSQYGLEMHPLQLDPAVVPPTDIVRKVQGSSKADPATFLGMGWRHALAVLELLEGNGFDIRAMRRML